MKKTISFFSLFMLLATNFMPLVSFANEPGKNLDELVTNEKGSLEGQTTDEDYTTTGNDETTEEKKRDNVSVATELTESDSAQTVDDNVEVQKSELENLPKIGDDALISDNSTQMASSTESDKNVDIESQNIGDNNDNSSINIAPTLKVLRGALSVQGTEDTADLTNGGCFEIGENNSVWRINIDNKECFASGLMVFPEGIKRINDWVWPYTDNNSDTIDTLKRSIRKVVLPSTLEYIGAGVFQGASNLSEINFPANLKGIGSWAFQSTAITEADISNVTEINEGVFQNAQNLSNVTFSDNLSYVGSYSFQSTKVESINLEKVSYIGEYAFANATSLQNVGFSRAIKHIGTGAFTNTNITEIKLTGIEYIGKEAFSKIPNLKNVYIDGSSSDSGAALMSQVFLMSPTNIIETKDSKFIFGENVIYLGEDLMQGSNANYIVVSGNKSEEPHTIKYGCVTDVKNWGQKNCGEITFTGTILSEQVFQQTKNLSGAYIGSGVTNIGTRAFLKSSIKTIRIEGSRFGTDIGYQAFQFVGLENIELGDGKFYIGNQAFQGTHIKHIELKSNVEYIGEQSFNQSWLESVSISGTDEGMEIPSMAFSMTRLTGVVIGTGVIKISEQAFQGLETLLNVEIMGHENGTRIETKSFNGAKNLKSLKIGSGVTYIGMQAFEMCEALETLTIEGNKKVGTEIDIAAFRKTQVGDKMERFYLGEGIKNIGHQAFMNFIVDDLIIPDSVINIDDEAFMGSNVKTLILGKSVKKIGVRAFASAGNTINEIVIKNLDGVTFGNNAFTYWQNEKLPILTTIDLSNPTESVSDSITRLSTTFPNGQNRELIQGRLIEFYNDGDRLYSKVEYDGTGYTIPDNLRKLGYELLGWKESGNSDLFNFSGAVIDKDRTFNSEWRSLAKKSEENNDNNVTYLKTTTVTVGNGEVVEDMNINETSYIELVATDELPEEIFTDNSKTAIKDSEIKSSSNAEVEYQGGVEVYIELTTNQVTEKKERIPGTAKFSVPVAVKVPVSSNKGEVRIKVKHEGGEFGYDGLTLNPVNICENGVAVEDKYNGEGVRVVNNNGERYATIYTCSASTFVAYTEKGIVYPSAGGGRTIVSTPTTTEKEHNSADINEQKENTKTNEETTNQIELNEKLLSMKLTRGEVAVMTNILLDVFPQLVEGKQELNDVENACSNYADAQKFTKSEKKAITRLCKLSIMGIHAETKKPLDEFMVKDFAKNNEFATVIDRSISTYNEKDLTVVKDALKKLENNEETVEFGTLYNVFMTVKNLLN